MAYSNAQSSWKAYEIRISGGSCLPPFQGFLRFIEAPKGAFFTLYAPLPRFLYLFKAMHGVSLALASAIQWPDVLCFVDDRADYGEVREVGYAVIAQRLYVVVFVQRGDTMRIISLRKANKREIKHYDQASQSD